MPHVSIVSAAGPLDVAYTIATPNSPSAKSIDTALPTVLLLHPLYLGQMSLHYQFMDPCLRRFNLVALDLRSHGESVGDVKSTYGVHEAVDDVVKFMAALQLPPVHLVGINLGSLIALDLAAMWPRLLLSLTLISPPSMVEPPEVAEGRQEIYECWAAGFGEGVADGKVDESAIVDAVCGSVQLGVNSIKTTIVTALTQTVLGAAVSHWAPPKINQYKIATVRFFTNRPLPLLRGIACPVQLVHCGADIAYPREGTLEILAALRAEGVDARMHDVPDAVQFGNITHHVEINPLIHDMVMECAAEQNVPLARKSVVSPYTSTLSEAGWRLDEDDDDLVVSD
ncbi:Alpha/Beta hydrolase protein [Mycena crocata]|nr:Alpha/Beta hydrolase protein [Mycena crocata]